MLGDGDAPFLVVHEEVLQGGEVSVEARRSGLGPKDGACAGLADLARATNRARMERREGLSASPARIDNRATQVVACSVAVCGVREGLSLWREALDDRIALESVARHAREH